jgi:hypothetical protein
MWRDIASSASAASEESFSGLSMTPATRTFIAGAGADVEFTDSESGIVLLLVADSTAVGGGILTAADPWPEVDASYFAWNSRLLGWLGVAERPQPAPPAPASATGK